MDKITVGVLTISDRCSRNEAIDESGSCIMDMISNGVIKNAVVVKMTLVPDNVVQIKEILEDWCGKNFVNLILTTGGTGISPTDVTPEATAKVLEKTLPGISSLLFKRSLDVTPLAALSRGIAGVRGKTLIINLPGSKKASKECLEAVACVIPHAIDLIMEKKNRVQEVHAALEGKKSLVVAGKPAARRRESAYPCISVSEAQKIIVERIFLLIKKKTVKYEEAIGHMLAEDVVARDNLPPFEASLKDGYAVLSSDTILERNVIGNSNAGDSLSNVEVTSGCCVRISTGAAVPQGADAIVQVEDTETLLVTKDQTEEVKIVLKKLPFKGQDIRPLGSDFKMGERLLTSKTYLDAAAIGFLAAAGVTTVRVYEKPLVAVLSTGNEIISPNVKLSPGKVRDSNRITLISLLMEEKFKALDLGITPDEPEALRSSLERGFRMADIVVTTGSMSMGERDYLKEVLVTDFNAEICFGRVLMKPGKPTAFGIVMFEDRPKLWFGLPGNPASALVTSHLFLLPALRKISGQDNIFPKSFELPIDIDIPLEDRPHYVRGVLKYNNGIFNLAPISKNQRSSYIGSCVNANCLIELKVSPNPETVLLKTPVSTPLSTNCRFDSGSGSRSGFNSGSGSRSLFNSGLGTSSGFNSGLGTSSVFNFGSGTDSGSGQVNPSDSGSKCKKVKAFLIGQLM